VVAGRAALSLRLRDRGGDRKITTVRTPCLSKKGPEKACYEGSSKLATAGRSRALASWMSRRNSATGQEERASFHANSVRERRAFRQPARLSLFRHAARPRQRDFQNPGGSAPDGRLRGPRVFYHPLGLHARKWGTKYGASVRGRSRWKEARRRSAIICDNESSAHTSRTRLGLPGGSPSPRAASS
jgi:hypothetical protein